MQVLLETPSMTELDELLVAVDNPHPEQPVRDLQAAPYDTEGEHTGYMVGAHPDLEEDEFEDDRDQTKQVDHRHCEENQTSDSRSVHAAAADDVGRPVVALDPLKEMLVVVVVEQEAARNEAHSLQALEEGRALGYSFPAMVHKD